MGRVVFVVLFWVVSSVPAVLTLLAADLARGQNGQAVSVPASAKRLPTLAVTVSMPEPDTKSRENVEDLLLVELARQPYLQLVDRQRLAAVMREHAIALSNLHDRHNALALGRFAGADYLLHVLLTKDTASVRLVEVATGQVKLEEEVAIGDDLTLSAAAIREKVLAAVEPTSQAVNRLTVGIAAFPNRSATGRSDELGLKLQKALRRRLKEQPWAVVLERQYPTALLEEVDLARLGLVRDNGVENLPPADLVILGSLQDVGKEYGADEPWEVKLDLTFRLRDHSHPISRTCRFDGVEPVADDIVREIDAFRNRQPESQATVPEKELWRRQALYLMPRPMLFGHGNAILPEFYRSSEVNKQEVVRAWENVLLLDDTNAEAMTYLGLCRIGFSRWFYNESTLSRAERDALTAQWVSASRYLERALNLEPALPRAATYLYCIKPMLSVAPARAKEMARYVEDHLERFAGIPASPWVKVALTTPSPSNDEEFFAQRDRALLNAANDPNAVLILFPEGLTRNGPVRPFTQLLTKYSDSPDPVVQFVVHRALGEMLSGVKKDLAALNHFDRAIAVMEEAYARCASPHRNSLNNIYLLKIEACKRFNRMEEAKSTAWAGANHFMKTGRFDSMEHFNASSLWIYESTIGRLYQYCVMECVDEGQEQQALAICDTYLAAAKPAWSISESWPDISAKREELLARLAGTPVPDMSGLRRIEGVDWRSASRVHMAVTGNLLWFVRGDWNHILYRYDRSRISEVFETRYKARSVAATDDAIFCGGRSGLFHFDLHGKLVKHYCKDNAMSFPGYGVGDVRVGGGKVYFTFSGSPHNGIACLDPASGKITVLAPTSREATPKTEPLEWTDRLWWDAANACLYATSYFHRSGGSPKLTRQYRWSAQDATWRRQPIEEAVQAVISEGNETLLVRTRGEQTEFHFVESGQTLTAAVPVPSMMGEPAWDDRHIWVPTASGLYEIDRASGRLTWLAYESGNHFRALLKAGDRLYVGTSQGLYCCQFAPTGPSEGLRNPPTNLPVAATASKKPEGAEEQVLPLFVDLSLEDDAQAEISITLGRDQVLEKAWPGKVSINLATLGDGKHHLYVHCPGYASQLIFVEVADGKASSRTTTVKLYRKRYVVLRCTFNKNGDRGLEGPGVEEQHVAVSHWNAPEPFRRDWMIWQISGESGPMFGDIPYLRMHRPSRDFGFTKPPADVSFEQMTEAPESGYHCKDLKAEKGLVLYCRVDGGARKGGLGYGKILVEDVTETPPDDVWVLENR